MPVRSACTKRRAEVRPNRRVQLLVGHFPDPVDDRHLDATGDVDKHVDRSPLRIAPRTAQRHERVSQHQQSPLPGHGRLSGGLQHAVDSTRNTVVHDDPGAAFCMRYSDRTVRHGPAGAATTATRPTRSGSDDRVDLSPLTMQPRSPQGQRRPSTNRTPRSSATTA